LRESNRLILIDPIPLVGIQPQWGQTVSFVNKEKSLPYAFSNVSGTQKAFFFRASGRPCGLNPDGPSKDHITVIF